MKDNLKITVSINTKAKSYTVHSMSVVGTRTIKHEINFKRPEQALEHCFELIKSDLKK
jgi:hypothetical protein